MDKETRGAWLPGLSPVRMQEGAGRLPGPSQPIVSTDGPLPKTGILPTLCGLRVFPDGSRTLS